MKTIIDIAKELLTANTQVSDYKVKVHRKDSYEMFFVKGKLETVRRTYTRDMEVTVYVDHDDFRGESQFLIYPYTTEEDLPALIHEAVEKAKLINNKHFTLPEAEQGGYDVPSNFSKFYMPDLASAISKAVFEANTIDHASLNSVEVFVNEHIDIISNSRGLKKEQRYFTAMVETIPTFNGEMQSVELYHQYNFSSFDRENVVREVRDMLLAVKARYEAITPDFPLDCDVVLNKQEVSELIWNIAEDLNYASVYSHSNLFSKGDSIQKDPKGDLISITMTGALEGSTRSSCFDADGLALTDRQIVLDGKAVDYFGSNRYGQYLGEKPTGDLRCLICDAGSVKKSDMPETYLEIISMSGLQVDFYTDYIGGEVRLAYYHDHGKITPVTGISVSGKLGEMLNQIRLSADCALQGSYYGPEQAILTGMSIF